MDDFKLNIVAGLIILIVDFVLTYLIFHKIVVERDRKRWKPFRLYLFNSLLSSGYYFGNLFSHIENDYKQHFEQMENGEPALLDDALKSLLDLISFTEQRFVAKRTEVLNSIQTSLTTISPNVSKRFSNIFKCLDNSVSLTTELGGKVYGIKTSPGTLTTQEISEKLRHEFRVYAMKMNGGFLYYIDSVKSIIEAEGLHVSGNEVLTREDILQREKISASFDKLKDN